MSENRKIISIALDKTSLEKIEYLKKEYGIQSRSAIMALAVTEMYSKVRAS